MTAPTLTRTLTIVAYGQPGPQGSKKAFRNQHTGRIQQVESSKKVAPWRDDVKAAAERVVARLAGDQDWAPLDGPLLVRMVFSIVRPAGHYGTGRNAGTLRASAPRWPSSTPDLSKLARSTEDALTAAGVWRDDARVVEYQRLAKVYVRGDLEALDRPGVVIMVTRLSKVDRS